MATWPTSLPCVLSEGYGEEPSSQVIETQPDTGPPKSRRRSTARTTTISVRRIFDDAQLATFEDFVDQESAEAVPFDCPHPRTGEMVKVRITGDPPYTVKPASSGGRRWKVSFQLQVQP